MNIEHQQSSGISFDSLVNSHENPFIVINKDYRILAINKAYEKNYGTSRSEAVGKPCYQVSHGNDRPCDLEGEVCPLKKVLDTGESCVCIHLHCDSNHRMHEVKVTAYPLRDPNGDLYIGESIETIIAPRDRRAGDGRMMGKSSAFTQLNVAPTDKPITNDQMVPDEVPSSLMAVEEQHIKALLHRFEGNRKKVALALGVSERTIYRKLKKLGLS